MGNCCLRYDLSATTVKQDRGCERSKLLSARGVCVCVCVCVCLMEIVIHDCA